MFLVSVDLALRSPICLLRVPDQSIHYNRHCRKSRLSLFGLVSDSSCSPFTSVSVITMHHETSSSTRHTSHKPSPNRWHTSRKSWTGCDWSSSLPWFLLFSFDFLYLSKRSGTSSQHTYTSNSIFFCFRFAHISFLFLSITQPCMLFYLPLSVISGEGFAI